MSEPSSEGRPSVSTRSSYTLNSRYSGSHVDNGEGNSIRSPGSRHISEGSHSLVTSASRNAQGPLQSESIEEQDFARRRHRNRKSGGFLLDSTFSSRPNVRQAGSSAHHEEPTHKRSSRHSHRRDGSAQRVRIQAGGSGLPHSSPLSRHVIMTDDLVAADANKIESTPDESNDALRVPKMRRDIGVRPPSTHPSNDDTIRPPNIDPNQLVHMALDLSESRRRNITAGLSIGSQTADSRRVRSSIAPQGDGSFRNSVTGNSLGPYMNEKRRASRNISPGGGTGSAAGKRFVSSPVPRSMSISVQGQQLAPSPATLARRDKARAYIELQMEYMRLLEYLPPLKPDSSAPGNYVFTANNVPGSPLAHLSRTPSHANAKHNLGRQYNPLQYLRNRRSRARERVILDHGSEEFTDIETVRDWVDRVENESRDPEYRQQDRVLLPTLHDDHQGTDAPSKPTRPRMGWIFTPEELLADAHWSEQGTHKTFLEDRHGRKIFNSMETRKPESQQARISKELPEYRRKSWVEGLPGKTGTDPNTDDLSDQGSDRGRKKRILPTFRAESPKHKKHSWRHSRPQSASYTDPTDSDSDSPKQRKARRIIDVNNNTGPLELRINEILEKEKEAREKQSRSPAIISPDTPDKWGTGNLDPPAADKHRDSLEVPRFSNGYIHGNSSQQDLKAPPRIRNDLTLNLDHEHRSSFEDLDSTAPNSPIHSKAFPHIGSDLSPPPSRGGSVKKTKKGKFDLFRSDDSTKSHKLETDGAGTDRPGNSRQLSEDVHEGLGLGTTILAAPGAVKSLLAHRKNDSVSSLPSPDTNRKDHRESKEMREQPSAVTRFLKGVKNEGSKVGEFIFRRDRPVDDSDTDTDDSEGGDAGLDREADNGKSRKNGRPDLSRTTTAATSGSITTKRNGRYHLELPSFRSAAHNEQDTSDVSDAYLSEDHVSRQARARANSRSPRFDKLAPPRMDLSSISVNSSPGISRSQSPDAAAAEERLSKVLARPGGVGQAGQPITSLAHPQMTDPSSRQRSISRPNLDGRHWSITDDNGNVLHRTTTPHFVTQTDIARMRALLLCSGVKAREIARRAHEQREEPPQFLKNTARAVNADLIPVPRQEEHVLAARILVQDLEASTQALQVSAQQFKDSAIKNLASKISDIKSRVESEIFPQVRDSGDEAVRITSEVSGTAPLTVKQVTDEIDKMIRMRKRRMRYMRRVGWMLVEWMLLGVMWWVWLIVVVLGFFRRGFGVLWAIIRWLLWL